MSMRYGASAVSFTLRSTVWPWSTLMSVANPWMVASPVPTPQVLWGVPGSWFSATIGLVEGTVRSSRRTTGGGPPRSFGPTTRRTGVDFQAQQGCWESAVPTLDGPKLTETRPRSRLDRARAGRIRFLRDRNCGGNLFFGSRPSVAFHLGR